MVLYMYTCVYVRITDFTCLRIGIPGGRRCGIEEGGSGTAYEERRVDGVIRGGKMGSGYHDFLLHICTTAGH